MKNEKKKSEFNDTESRFYSLQQFDFSTSIKSQWENVSFSEWKRLESRYILHVFFRISLCHKDRSQFENRGSKVKGVRSFGDKNKSVNSDYAQVYII